MTQCNALSFFLIACLSMPLTAMQPARESAASLETTLTKFMGNAVSHLRNAATLANEFSQYHDKRLRWSNSVFFKKIEDGKKLKKVLLDTILKGLDINRKKILRNRNGSEAEFSGVLKSNMESQSTVVTVLIDLSKALAFNYEKLMINERAKETKKDYIEEAYTHAKFSLDIYDKYNYLICDDNTRAASLQAQMDGAHALFTGIRDRYEQLFPEAGAASKLKGLIKEAQETRDADESFDKFNEAFALADTLELQFKILLDQSIAYKRKSNVKFSAAARRPSLESQIAVFVKGAAPLIRTIEIARGLAPDARPEMVTCQQITTIAQELSRLAGQGMVEKKPDWNLCLSALEKAKTSLEISEQLANGDEARTAAILKEKIKAQIASCNQNLQVLEDEKKREKEQKIIRQKADEAYDKNFGEIVASFTTRVKAASRMKAMTQSPKTVMEYLFEEEDEEDDEDNKASQAVVGRSPVIKTTETLEELSQKLDAARAEDDVRGQIDGYIAIAEYHRVAAAQEENDMRLIAYFEEAKSSLQKALSLIDDARASRSSSVTKDDMSIRDDNAKMVLENTGLLLREARERLSQRQTVLENSEAASLASMLKRDEDLNKWYVEGNSDATSDNAQELEALHVLLQPLMTLDADFRNLSRALSAEASASIIEPRASIAVVEADTAEPTASTSTCELPHDVTEDKTSTSVLVPLQIQLPQQIKTIFSIVVRDETNRGIFLSHSTVHALLDGKVLTAGKSIDLVVESDGPFHTKGFKKSNRTITAANGTLYHALVYGYPVECSVKSSDDNFLCQHGESQNFTIESLFLDQHGLLHDPTGEGFKDFKTKILRTNAEPHLHFKKDPPSLLHAVRYMSSGFIPTAEVDAAMRAWRKAKINKNHFRAIARNAMRNLSDAEREKYLEHLKDYDLLAKLFDAGFKDIDVTAFLEIISSTKNFQRPLSATLTSSRNIHLCATPDDAHDGRFFNIYIAGSSENHGVKESNIRTPRIIRLNSAAKNEDAEYDIVINSNGVVKRVQASDELTQMLRIVLFPTVYAGMVDGKVFDQVAENIIYLGATTPVIAAIENLGQTHFDE